MSWTEHIGNDTWLALSVEDHIDLAEAAVRGHAAAKPVMYSTTPFALVLAQLHLQVALVKATAWRHD